MRKNTRSKERSKLPPGSVAVIMPHPDLPKYAKERARKMRELREQLGKQKD